MDLFGFQYLTLLSVMRLRSRALSSQILVQKMAHHFPPKTNGYSEKLPGIEQHGNYSLLQVQVPLTERERAGFVQS
jgi:hypothetical protein